MSLISNSANLEFDTSHAIDKIVGVWEGSFNKATDVVERVGSMGSIYVYRIPHNFPRPIFVDLLWSDDNVTWVDGGAASAGDVSLAFSDNSYVYIISSLFATAVGTRYYKAIGFWIDDYDSTNPLVAGYESPNKTINFDSRLNYQKIYVQGSKTFFESSTKSITHNLNKRPNFRVFFEAFPDEVWPLNGIGANPFVYDDDQAECYAQINDITLDIELFYTIPSNRKAWYRIYLDTV